MCDYAALNAALHNNRKKKKVSIIDLFPVWSMVVAVLTDVILLCFVCIIVLRVRINVITYALSPF